MKINIFLINVLLKQSHHLRQDHILPNTVETLQLHLSPSVELKFSEGFFRYKHVKNLLVYGGLNVEFSTNAMNGILSPNLNITIIGSNTFVFQQMALNKNLKLSVYDIQLFPKAFADTRFILKFQRILDLSIHEGAFAWSTCRNIYRFALNSDGLGHGQFVAIKRNYK